MSPINFDGVNIDLIKPDDMSDEACLSLPAERGTDDSGLPYFLTAWVPNYEDLKALKEGRPLYLKMIGYTFQPVCLFTVDENGEGNF